MPGPEEATRLALAAGRGDRDALAEFIRATQADVWRFLARSAGRALADDLTQETYLRVLEALPRFEGRSSARTWLLAIARRVVVDRYRHDSVRPRLVGADCDDLGASPASEDVHGVEVLLGRLDPERRDALVLTRLMGFSYAEAAEICGCPVGTIRSRVARARTELAAALTPA